MRNKSTGIRTKHTWRRGKLDVIRRLDWCWRATKTTSHPGRCWGHVELQRRCVGRRPVRQLVVEVGTDVSFAMAISTTTLTNLVNRLWSGAANSNQRQPIRHVGEQRKRCTLLG